jgi:DNA-binding transcriptional MerR regulator
MIYYGGEHMYSIGKLAGEFNLSRSALIYYDTVGLLSPSERNQVNYRQYSEADKKRLGQICALREAGVPLNEIKEILDTNGMNERSVLERHLNDLTQEIRYLRFQQKMIVEMLKGKDLKSFHNWEINSMRLHWRGGFCRRPILLRLWASFYWYHYSQVSFSVFLPECLRTAGTGKQC